MISRHKLLQAFRIIPLVNVHMMMMMIEIEVDLEATGMPRSETARFRSGHGQAKTT
jgi:hypothetical protein